MIRYATEADRTAIGRVYCYSWKKGYEGILPSEYLAALSVENCSPKRIIPESNLVYEDNNGIAGVINFGAGRDDKTTGEIRAIYVLPEYWGGEVGRTLFQSAMYRLRQMKFDGCYLWVLINNARARRFYEKNNMVCDNVERSISIAGSDYTEIKYVGRTLLE